MIPKINRFTILLFILICTTLTLLWFVYNEQARISTNSYRIKALTDTVTLYKTKTGKSGATRLVFNGNLNDVKTVLKSQDATAYNYVNKTKGIQSYTDFTTRTRIDTVVKADTVYMVKDTTGKLKVNLIKNIQEPKGFYTAKINVENDSVGLKLQMFDKYHITTSEKSNGWFKGKSLVINVENENPYITLTGVKSFNIQEENKHTGLKIGGAVAIGLGVFLLLHK